MQHLKRQSVAFRLALRLVGLVFWLGVTLPVVAQAQIAHGFQSRLVPAFSKNIDVGVLEVRIGSDVLAGASPEDPVFVRITLDQGLQLAETLVAPTQDPAMHRPVFMPLVLETASVGYRLAAPADSLAVVRWVAGESEIWLSLQSDSAQWIDTGSNRVGPSWSHPVRFYLGASAAQNWAFLGDTYAAGRANLPAPVFDAAQPSQDQAVSTLLCGDLYDSLTRPSKDLAHSGYAYSIQFYRGSHGVDSATAVGEVQPGSEIEVRFERATQTLGQVIQPDTTCTLRLNEVAVATPTLCRPDHDAQGLVHFEASARLLADCGQAMAAAGGRVGLQFSADQAYRFQIAVDGEGRPLQIDEGEPVRYLLVPGSFAAGAAWSPAWCWAEHAEQTAQGWLTHTAYADLSGAGSDDLAFDVQLRGVIVGTTVNATTAPVAATPYLTLTLPDPVWRPQATEPFNAPWQASHCAVQTATHGGFTTTALVIPEVCSYVEIANPELETAVLAAHDANANGRLDRAEVDLLVELDISGMGLTSLAGLEVLTALERLYAADNALTDYRALADLPALSVLDLRHNQLQDIGVLALMPFIFSEANHRLDLRGNLLTEQAATCEVLAHLLNRDGADTAELLVNPQYSGRFYPDLAAWRGDLPTVLYLVERVNRDGRVFAPYAICQSQEEVTP